MKLTSESINILPAKQGLIWCEYKYLDSDGSGVSEAFIRYTAIKREEQYMVVANSCFSNYESDVCACGARATKSDPNFTAPNFTAQLAIVAKILQ